MSAKFQATKDTETHDNNVNSVELRGSSLVPTRWHQMTTFKKTLLVLGLLFIVTIVAAFIFQPSSVKDHAQESKIEHVLGAMDLSVDPCADFYSYSCNGWIKANPIPKGKSTWSTFLKIEQQNQLVIKHALEQPIQNFKSKAEKKAKMYYESCLDVHTIEELGATPLVTLVRKLGGWNITESGFDPEKWSFQNVTQSVQNKYNIGAFFSCTVAVDQWNSSRYVLKIEDNELTLPSNYYLNHDHWKIREAYLDYMTAVGVLLGGEFETTRTQMEDVMMFEAILADIFKSKLQLKFYHRVTFGELNRWAKFIDWCAVFENALELANCNMTSIEKIEIFVPEYLGRLSQQIENYKSTVSGTIILNNYLVWQTVRHFASSLSKPFRDAYNHLRKVLDGSEVVEEPRWRYCVEETTKVFGFAIGSMFARAAFDTNSKNQAEEMLSNVRNAFVANFANLDWMDESTREKATVKAEAMSIQTGYPEFILNPKELDEVYESLQVRGHAFFDNNLKYKFWTFKQNLEKFVFSKPVDKNEWPAMMPPSRVNAFYSNSKNQMAFAAGIFQPPLYDPSFPPSVNYGTVGFFIGHELTHGFDDHGRRFDKNGNLNNWWNSTTSELFENRTKCFVSQYSKFKVDGSTTLVENVADNGGLKAAYRAYLTLMKDEPELAPFPDLSLNPNQLFFVAFAQAFCASITEEAAALRMEENPHSLNKVRVAGTLGNFQEFSDVFQCPRGSRMNPERKCDLW